MRPQQAIVLAISVVAACTRTQVWPAAPGSSTRIAPPQQVEIRFATPRTISLVSGQVHTTLPNIISLNGDVERVSGDTAYVTLLEANNGAAFIEVPYHATVPIALDSTVVATWDHKTVGRYVIGLAALVAAVIALTFVLH